MAEPKFTIPEFEGGYHAGLRGDDPRTCPYEKMTKEYNRWQFAHRVGTKIYLEALNETKDA